jgi:hypothetical protein
MEFGEGVDDEAIGDGVLIADIGLQTQFFNNLMNFFLVRNIRPILTHDPGNHLHQTLRDIRIFLENFKVNLNGALSELLSVLLALVLSNDLDKFIGEVLGD